MRCHDGENVRRDPKTEHTFGNLQMNLECGTGMEDYKRMYEYFRELYEDLVIEILNSRTTKTGRNFEIDGQTYVLTLFHRASTSDLYPVPDESETRYDYDDIECTAPQAGFKDDCSEEEMQDWLDKLNEKTGCNFTAANFPGR